MPKGGKMPGAGRPKGALSKKTIKQEEALEYLRNRIRENYDMLIDKLLYLATGNDETIKKVKGADGTMKSYVKQERLPSKEAIEFMLTMVTGKAKESLLLESPELKELALSIRAMLDKPKTTKLLK